MMKKLSLQVAMGLLSITALTACATSGSPRKESISSEVHTTHSDGNQYSHSAQPGTSVEPKQIDQTGNEKKNVIVLVHGIGNTDTMVPLEKALRRDIPGTIIYNIQRKDSKEAPIERQGEVLYEQILNHLVNDNLNFADLKVKVIALSQGAAVAEVACHKNVELGYLLDIALCLVNGPLEGIPAVTFASQELAQLTNALAHPTLHQLGAGQLAKQLSNTVTFFTAGIEQYFQGVGATDLAPDSAIMQKLKQKRAVLFSTIKTTLITCKLAPHTNLLLTVMEGLGGLTYSQIKGLTDALQFAEGLVGPGYVENINQVMANIICKGLNHQTHDGLVPYSMHQLNVPSYLIENTNHFADLYEGEIYTVITQFIQQ